MFAKGIVSTFDAVRPVPTEHANPINTENKEETLDTEEKKETPEK